MEKDYCVVRFGGKQFLVSEGEEVEVEGVLGKEGEEIEFKEVLLTRQGERVEVGAPLLSNIVVKGKIVRRTKGEKVRGLKYKAKTGYRRKYGFRQTLSIVRMEKILEVRKSQERVKKTSKKKVAV